MQSIILHLIGIKHEGNDVGIGFEHQFSLTLAIHSKIMLEENASVLTELRLPDANM